MLALELALGIAFLVYAVSTKISVEEPIKFYQERYPETLVELTTNHGAAALQQVTAKDIAMLREILPGFTLKTKVQAFFFEPVEGKLKNNFAVYLLPPGLADGQAYYGAELAKALQEKPVLIDLIGRYQLTQTELWDTLANLRLPASPLPKEYARVTDTTNPGGRPTDGENTQYTYAYSDSLFLPQTYAEQARSGSFTNYLWDTAGSEDAELMQKKALDYLASQYPDIDFLFQYPGQQLAEVTGDMSAAAQMLGPIA